MFKSGTLLLFPITWRIFQRMWTVYHQNGWTRNQLLVTFYMFAIRASVTATQRRTELQINFNLGHLMYALKKETL